MIRNSSRRRAITRWLVCCAFLTTVMYLGAVAAYAGKKDGGGGPGGGGPGGGGSTPPPEPIIRIEEDWYVLIKDPDADNEGPQITTVISPQANLLGHHCVFAINYADLPNFALGGTQLQIWHQNNDLVLRSSPNWASLWHANEVIQFTMKMEITTDGQLDFEIINGTSQTWGTFGGQGYLKGQVPTTLTDLSTYSPTLSIDESGMTRSNHNVDNLIRTEVRYYSAANGLEQTVTTDQSVHAHTNLVRFMTYDEYLLTPYNLDATVSTGGTGGFGG